MSAAKVCHDPARCIHDLQQDKCCLCNGYVRWLIADEERLRRAQAKPEATRREFWRDMQDKDWSVA